MYTVRTSIYVVFNFLTVTSLTIVFKLKCVCGLCFSYSKCAEKTFITESPLPCQTGKSGWICNCLFYQNSWNFTSYCMQFFLGNISIFKSVSLSQ
jgi:hypothetical protein